MEGDFRKLLFWNVLASIPAGLVSVLLPLYLAELGIDYSGMGFIFGQGQYLAS
ncbi:MAG: hypothetical protein JW727_01635 [Candidatus Aenigmarchaeota archaeon]|nr:hypothetical protein [Candidatus Aenigmarchaeota archaeon]